MSGWAQKAKTTGRSIYDIGIEQLRSLAAKPEDMCMDAIVARAVAASMVADGSGGTLARTTPASVLPLLGDELFGGMPALWAMNSKVYWDLAGPRTPPTARFSRPPRGGCSRGLGGVPVKMSDRSTMLVPSTSPQQLLQPAREAERRRHLDRQHGAVHRDRP